MSDHDPQRDGARADLSRLLSACYYEPAPMFEEERLFDSVVLAASRIDPALEDAARRLERAFAADSLQDLLVDYARLFIGPTGAPAKPYGSVWMENPNEVMGESTLAVLALYREAGFELSENFREVPDHLAVELEFLYVLVFREALARRDGDAAALAEAGRLRQRLLAEHLGRWVPKFAAACRANAHTGFYRELADITEGFVSSEAATPRVGVIH